MATEIHPSSVIEKGAIIGHHAKIGPLCYVGETVEIEIGRASCRKREYI